MSSEKISQLQLLQQNLQTLVAQKQQVQEQLTELNSALEELETTDKAYKIVGKLMISANKDNLTKDLNEKAEVANLRLKNITNQENKLKGDMESLQEEVMKDLKEKKE